MSSASQLLAVLRYIPPCLLVGGPIEGTRKKKSILHVVDRSVALDEEPWHKTFEKYRKCCDFDDFSWKINNFDTRVYHTIQMDISKNGYLEKIKNFQNRLKIDFDRTEP